MTDLSDYKKIGVVHKNRRVFGERYIFIYLSQTRWSTEHTHARIHTHTQTNNYSFTPSIFQYDLKSNIFTNGKLPCKLAVKAKGKLTHNENGQEMRCNAKTLRNS